LHVKTDADTTETAHRSIRAKTATRGGKGGASGSARRGNARNQKTSDKVAQSGRKKSARTAFVSVEKKEGEERESTNNRIKQSKVSQSRGERRPAESRGKREKDQRSTIAVTNAGKWWRKPAKKGLRLAGRQQSIAPSESWL